MLRDQNFRGWAIIEKKKEKKIYTKQNKEMELHFPQNIVVCIGTCSHNTN